MNYAIEIKNLRKSFQKKRVVDDLNINVPEGKVYGFLGKNGAGKTTTIRMIMGLVRPDTGYINLNGRPIHKYRRWAAGQIGAIIETPGFYNNLSARENLSITARLYGAASYRIGEVLKMVALDGEDNKRVQDFSLGMKQRLGIANALIHAPEILILDEPTNGLDPVGIKEMRSFISELSKTYGITTVISSHILSEIEQIVDYVGIIDQGRLIEENDITSILTGHQTHLRLEVDDIKSAGAILQGMGMAYETGDREIVLECHRESNDTVNRSLINGGVRVFAFIPVLPTLEDRFIQTVRSA